MARSLVVIEDVDDTGTHWFLSFDGPNPSEGQCVRCVDRTEAFKLKSLVDGTPPIAMAPGRHVFV